MVFTVSRVKGSKGSEVTPVEFPWGNPIQLGKEVRGRKDRDQRSEVRGRRTKRQRSDVGGREKTEVRGRGGVYLPDCVSDGKVCGRFFCQMVFFESFKIHHLECICSAYLIGRYSTCFDPSPECYR